MSLPAGSIRRQGDDDPVAAFNGSFFYTTSQLQVTSTSPAAGSVVTLPFTDLVVHFNKAFDPYSITTSNLSSARARS